VHLSFVISKNGADSIRANFCLTARGDSMVNAHIYDGDIVYIRDQQSVTNGEIAAVIVNDEVTLKRLFYYREKNQVILQPENPLYEPLIYSDEELNHIRIIGKAVAVTHHL
jgi:repressor LexA